MNSIQNKPQIPSAQLNTDSLSKQSSVNSKQPKNPGNSKNIKSFQEMLEKPKKQPGNTGRKNDNELGKNSQTSQPTQSLKETKEAQRDIGIPQPTITGTHGDDFLIGTSDRDVISGKGGNDVLLGRGGNDELRGRTGNDVLVGGRGNDSLSGGSGNDFLLGGNGRDSLSGNTGNDFLFGGKGKDVLFGGSGNDTLVGGKGGDLLHASSGNNLLLGGQGADSLNGGRGNDVLLGGTGNDRLFDDFGNNKIDGGRGHDTFGLRKGIDSYDISTNEQGDFVIRELPFTPHLQVSPAKDEIVFSVNEESVNTIKNVESFQFADVKMSASELRDHINNPDKDLPLTEPEKKSVESVFNINNASVEDSNGDKKISAGDTASGTLFRETGTINVSYEISQDNADHINGVLGSKLPLTAERLDIVDKVVNSIIINRDSPEGVKSTPAHALPGVSARGVLDSDGSGSLSVGDVVYSRSKLNTTGGDPIGGSPTYHRLTAHEIQIINSISNPKPLVLTDEQDSAIKEHFDIGNRDIGNSYRVLDSDANERLSKGDVLEINIGGSAYKTIRLTEKQIDAINNPPHKKLELSEKQHAAIGARFNHTPPPHVTDGITTRYTGTAIDQNNDGKLSVGDIVKLQRSGGLQGLNEIVDHVLISEDISAIEPDRVNPLLDISNGLSSEQKQGLYTVLFGGYVSTSAPSIESVFDHNSDGKLSVGDALSISRFDEKTGQIHLSFHTLTQNNLDHFLGHTKETLIMH